MGRTCLYVFIVAVMTVGRNAAVPVLRSSLESVRTTLAHDKLCKHVLVFKRNIIVTSFADLYFRTCKQTKRSLASVSRC